MCLQKHRKAAEEEDVVKEKCAKRLEEAKMEVAREKEVRVVIEKSHLSLLSRVQDMEEAIAHERTQVLQLSSC